MKLNQVSRNMRSKYGLYGAVAAIALWAALSLSPSVASAKAPSKRLELGLTRIQTDWLDNGTAGPSLGDNYLFIETLFRKGKDAGKSGGWCTVVGAQAPFETMTYQCVATLRLAEGQINLQGLLDATGPDDPRPFTLAITGGTGAYRGASGEGILTLTKYDLRFDSPPKKQAASKKHLS